MNPKGVLLGARGVMYYPIIGGCFGICEAMLIQQIHFRCKANGHHKEGQLWVWNSLREWAEELCMGVSTVQRAIYHLEKIGVLVVGKFNKHKYDSTKWYRVNYETLGELLKKHYNGQHEIVLDTLFKMNIPPVQNEQIHLVEMNRPIPEMSSEMSSEIKTIQEKTKPTVRGITYMGRVIGGSARDIAQNYQDRKAEAAGKPKVFRNTSQTLEFIWYEVVASLEGSAGFVPKLSFANQGLLTKLCRAWGKESEHVFPFVLKNWIGYVKYVAAQAGLHKTPDAPILTFLVKYKDEAMRYHKLNAVQLTAQKSKIVLKKIVKEAPALEKEAVPVIESEEEPQASLEDILAYLKF